MKLFGTQYTVDLHKDQNHPALGGDDAKAWFYERRISLLCCPEYHPDILLRQYLHEVVHFLDWDLEIGLSEEKTKKLALGLASWILENGIQVKIE